MAKVLSHEIIDESIPHDPESTVRYKTVVCTMVAFGCASRLTLGLRVVRSTWRSL